jgi:hypothetical protein
VEIRATSGKHDLSFAKPRANLTWVRESRTGVVTSQKHRQHALGFNFDLIERMWYPLDISSKRLPTKRRLTYCTDMLYIMTSEEPTVLVV